MTFAVVFRHVAQTEFDQAALWYEEQRLGLGTEFVVEIAPSGRQLSIRNAIPSCTAIFGVFEFAAFHIPCFTASSNNASSCSR